MRKKFTSLNDVNLGVVNLHFTSLCQDNCKMCHSRFIKDEVKPDYKFWKNIIERLSNYCHRINFAGGEPLFYPDLTGDLIKFTHSLGLIASIVTNGANLSYDWLKRYGSYVKAIGISCDSSQDLVNYTLGRTRKNHASRTIRNFNMIREYNIDNPVIKTKLNTVITRYNFEEDMSEFVRKCDVKRWKILHGIQIVHNEIETVQDIFVSKNGFIKFCKNHRHLSDQGIEIVYESNEEMIETYVMVDPFGRFFSNKNFTYKFSSPLTEISVIEALAQINFKVENLSGINRMFLDSNLNLNLKGN